MAAGLKGAIEELNRRGLPLDGEVPDDIRADLDRSQSVFPVDATFEAETLTECFYFVVGRLRQLLRVDDTGNRPLPGLGDLRHRGAVRVRDKLVEHYRPPPSAPIASYFGMGGDRGPVLRLEQDAEEDAGLYVNARELADEVDSKLTAAIARHRKQATS